MAFMETMTPDTLAPPSTPCASSTHAQYEAAARELGVVATQAFIDADGDEFRNKALSVASDCVMVAGAQAVFREVLGREMPMTLLVHRVACQDGAEGREELGPMLDWSAMDGFGADVRGCRRRYGMVDTRTWLKD